jgi:hypothetical protein
LALLAAVLLGGAGGEDYDRLFEAHDYGILAERLKRDMAAPSTARSVLAWEQHRLVSGGSIFLDAMYALNLLAARPEGVVAADDAKIRENAVVVGLYTLAAIETDGTKCADVAAPAARRRQFVQILTPVWIELRKLPDEAVASALAQALSEEAALAGTRRPDDYLCRGRTGDIPDIFASGVEERAPRFVEPPVWAEKTQAVRAQLPALLTEFATRLKSDR